VCVASYSWSQCTLTFFTDSESTQLPAPNRIRHAPPTRASAQYTLPPCASASRASAHRATPSLHLAFFAVEARLAGGAAMMADAQGAATAARAHRNPSCALDVHRGLPALKHYVKAAPALVARERRARRNRRRRER
jgi:hypothetical protein